MTFLHLGGGLLFVQKILHEYKLGYMYANNLMLQAHGNVRCQKSDLTLRKPAHAMYRDFLSFKN